MLKEIRFGENVEFYENNIEEAVKYLKTCIENSNIEYVLFLPEDIDPKYNRELALTVAKRDRERGLLNQTS